MTHIWGRVALGKDPRSPHSEGSVSGSDRDPQISRPVATHRHVAADRYYSAPLGPV